MAELNLKQIIDRLNAEFTGDTRKLVFWYDDKGDWRMPRSIVWSRTISFIRKDFWNGKIRRPII